jgi:hypothetical protein
MAPVRMQRRALQSLALVLNSAGSLIDVRLEDALLRENSHRCSLCYLYVPLGHLLVQTAQARWNLWVARLTALLPAATTHDHHNKLLNTFRIRFVCLGAARPVKSLLIN